MSVKSAPFLIGTAAILCLTEQAWAQTNQDLISRSSPPVTTADPNVSIVPQPNSLSVAQKSIAAPEGLPPEVSTQKQPVRTLSTDQTGSLEPSPTALDASPAVHPLEQDSNAVSPGMEQVSSVSQLSDVQPTAWAFQALQSLVERYGCIAGYPGREALPSAERTFRGNRALTRYEFAAGLNACLNRINELIESNVAESVKSQDLEAIKRLQEDFRTELTAIRGRLDTLEARTNVLEKQQFSTTSILGGEAIFGLVTGFGGKPPGGGENNPVLVSTSRLQLNTSFTGRDRLRFELEAGNFSGLGFADPRSLNSLNALLSFQSDTGNNRLLLSTLEYRFAVGDRLVVTARPVGFSLSTVLTANSPYFSDSQGSVSRFGQLSPIFRIGNLDAGVGFDWLISRRLRFQFAYGANNAANPQDGFLLGKEGHALGAQLLILPSDNLQIGVTLVNGFSRLGRLDTFTGSRIADASGFINQRAQIYALNLSLQWEISPKVVFAAWGGLAATYAAETNAGAASTTFLASLGFRDPFNRKQGDLLAFLVGQPLSLLHVNNTTVSTGLVTDNAFSLHAEVFYRFRISDNLSITPGFFLVTNPGNFQSNNTIYVGTIRSSFRF